MMTQLLKFGTIAIFGLPNMINGWNHNLEVHKNKNKNKNKKVIVREISL